MTKHKHLMKRWIRFALLGAVVILCLYLPFIVMSESTPRTIFFGAPMSPSNNIALAPAAPASFHGIGYFDKILASTGSFYRASVGFEPMPNDILFSDPIAPPENLVLISASSSKIGATAEKSMEFGALAGGEGIAEKPTCVPLGFEGVCAAAFFHDSGGREEAVFSGTNIVVDSMTGAFKASREGLATITASSASDPSKSDTWFFSVNKLKVMGIHIHASKNTAYVGYKGTVSADPQFSFDTMNSSIAYDFILNYRSTNSQIRWSGNNIEIDPDTGNWCAVNPGIATIRATLVSDDAIFAETHITVHKSMTIEAYIGTVWGYVSSVPSVTVFYADGTSRRLEETEFEIIDYSDNLAIAANGGIFALAPGQSSITVALVENPEIRHTWAFEIEKVDKISMRGDLFEVTAIGASGYIYVENHSPGWTVESSENMDVTGDINGSNRLFWKALAAGPAWVKVTTGDPNVYRLWHVVIYDQEPISVTIASVTIDGVTYTGKSNFPNEVSTSSVIVPKAEVTFADGSTSEWIRIFDEETRKPVEWSCDGAVHFSQEGFISNDSDFDAESTIFAKLRSDSSVQDSWTFRFVGPISCEYISGLPQSMALGEAVSLVDVCGLRYTNAPADQQDQQLVWTLAANSVQASIVNNQRLVATHPGMIRICCTSAANPSVSRTWYIWVENPCCDDYKTCFACSQNPDYHNSALCSCKHNFPFYCPLCKGPCKKYIQPDANGYFHTLVGSSLMPNGAIGIGTTEVRELKIPRGAKASCCARPCPPCLLSEENCSGRDCTCGHDFPIYCPLCKGPCSSYRTFGSDGYCHYMASDGRIAKLTPSLDALLNAPLSSGKECEVCKTYRVDIYRVQGAIEYIGEVGLYAGGLACKCKPLFPAYCPYCGGPCEKTDYGKDSTEWHYLAYRPAITQLGPKINEYGVLRSATVTGAVARNSRNVLPAGGDVEFNYYPSLNSSLDGRSDMKKSFLQSYGTQTGKNNDEQSQPSYAEEYATPNLADGGGGASSSVINLWLGGDDAAFFMDASLISSLKKQTGADFEIIAATGQDLEGALEKALSSATPPDVVLLPVEHLIRQANKWARLDPLIDRKTMLNLSSSIHLLQSSNLIRDGSGLLLCLPLPNQASDGGEPMDEQSLAFAVRSKASSKEKAAIMRMMEFLYSEEGRKLLENAERE